MEEVYSLVDSNTYIKKISLPQSIVEEYFKKIVIEYFEFIHKDEKKIVMANLDVFKFTLVRGLETMAHVFKMMLLYTNNVSAAIYHAQRSICLYIEFVLQVIENNHTFLKLTTKDAVLYVYKETVFRLKRDVKRPTSSNRTTNIDIEIDNINNEKYNMRENIDKILYAAVEYIQHEMTEPEVSQHDIDAVFELTKVSNYITSV